MKKGTKIIKVEIATGGKTTAYTMDRNGNVAPLKLSYGQRKLFQSEYNDPDFKQDVAKEFGADVLDEYFVIEKNGKQVYPPKEEDK